MLKGTCHAQLLQISLGFKGKGWEVMGVRGPCDYSPLTSRRKRTLV